MAKTPEEQVQEQLEGIKKGLETNFTSKAAELAQAVENMQTALKSENAETIKKAISENLGTVNQGIKDLSDWRKDKDDKDEKNQKALDDLLVQIKQINKNTQPKGEVVTFGDLFNEALSKKENIEGINSVGKNRPYKIQLFKRDDSGFAVPQSVELTDRVTKTSGILLTSDHLTGDSQATYGPSPILYKGHRINFRDLLPTVFSPTGLYVQYRENSAAGTATVARQTEGSAKQTMDYAFTEVKTATQYVAGTLRFAKQMARNLPWMQGTLPRLMLRDFYMSENTLFFATASAAATGSTTTVETADEKQLIDLITNQLDANFDPSFILMSNKGVARILKNLYGTGYYFGSGSIIGNQDGTVKIMNTQIINASWVTADKAFIFDRDYLERIEVESLAVEFFEQDQDNVPKNLITARIECMEEINPMLPSSMIYTDMGNASF
jgi:hypothetical protein